MTVTLAQAKDQLRVRHNDQNEYITSLIARAKAWVERYTATLVAAGAVVENFTEFGDYITLGRGPLVSLTSIAYVDAAGDDETVDDARPLDGKIYPPLAGWPSYAEYTPIVVTYEAGYTTTPEELDQAMLVLIEWWFCPDDKIEIDPIEQVPLAVVALARPFRLPTLR